MKPENYWGPLAYIEKYNLDIKGIIHVGAHFGGEVEHYMAHGIRDIVFFEPLEFNYEKLQDNIRNLSANIITHKIALGNKTEEVFINVSSNNGASSSVLNPKLHLEIHPEVEFVGKEKVQMKTLDSYSYQKYNTLIVDVQGYELEVFKGSEQTLNYIDYVYCEINRDEVYENNAKISDLDQYLSKYNFHRVETVWWCGDGIWGDSLYVKNL